MINILVIFQHKYCHQKVNAQPIHPQYDIVFWKPGCLNTFRKCDIFIVVVAIIVVVVVVIIIIIAVAIGELREDAGGKMAAVSCC